jgi:hypothetical protein
LLAVLDQVAELQRERQEVVLLADPAMKERPLADPGGRMRRPPRILRWRGSKEEPGIACGRAATRIATP